MASYRNRKHSRAGAIVILVSQLSVAFAILTIAVLYIGRWTNQKEEAQNQADALSMAAMQIARTEGIAGVCQHPVIQQMLARNGNLSARMDDCGRFVEIRNPNGTTSLQFVANTVSELEVGPLAQPYMRGERNFMRSRARAAITQENFDEAERRLPKFVLVLDYSGSMNSNFGNGSRLDSLKRAVNGLMDLQLDVEYGLVMFSSDVMRTEPIRPNNEARIRQAIARGTDGSTNYQAALDAARGLFNGLENTGRYVLFITDGSPTAGGDPMDAADRVRRNDTTIFTLNIGGGAAQADLLKDMSGSMDPAEYGNADFYFSAVNERELLDTFAAIIANILCAVGPLQGQIARPEEVHAFLRDNNGQEIPLDNQPNLSAPGVRNSLSYNYDPAERKVRLSERACDEVLDNGADIIVRYGQLDLVQ